MPKFLGYAEIFHDFGLRNFSALSGLQENFKKNTKTKCCPIVSLELKN